MDLQVHTPVSDVRWNMAIWQTQHSYFIAPCRKVSPALATGKRNVLSAIVVELVRNLVAHGDTREGKWRGNWRMEWVASTLTPPPNVVYPALLKLMRTPRPPAVDWTDVPHRFKWTRPFLGKTKSGFCACAITFRTSLYLDCFSDE